MNSGEIGLMIASMGCGWELGRGRYDYAVILVVAIVCFMHELSKAKDSR